MYDIHVYVYYMIISLVACGCMHFLFTFHGEFSLVESP